MRGARCFAALSIAFATFLFADVAGAVGTGPVVVEGEDSSLVSSGASSESDVRVGTGQESVRARVPLDGRGAWNGAFRAAEMGRRRAERASEKARGAEDEQAGRRESRLGRRHLFHAGHFGRVETPKETYPGVRSGNVSAPVTETERLRRRHGTRVPEKWSSNGAAVAGERNDGTRPFDGNGRRNGRRGNGRDSGAKRMPGR